MPRKRHAPKSVQPAAGSLAFLGQVKLSIQAQSPGGKKQRRFEMVAYTGEPLVLNWWDHPVVVDLDGIDAGNGVIPILYEHGPKGFDQDSDVGNYVVGQSESAAVENGKFVVRGPIFETERAGKVTALADQGFSWQASIGAHCERKDFVAEGNEAQVNGRTYEGPCYVSRKTQVREVSFVVIGADRNTEVLVAQRRGLVMNFDNFVRAKGFDPATLTEAQKAYFRDAFKAACKAEDEDEEDAEDSSVEEEKEEEEAEDEEKAQGEEDEKAEDEEEKEEAEDEEKKEAKGRAKGRAKISIRADMRRQAARECTRINTIHSILAGKENLQVRVKGKAVNLEASALSQGWSVSRTRRELELAELRAGRPTTPNTWYSPSGPVLNEAVIEAAVLQAGRCQLFNQGFYGQQGVAEDIANRTQRELNARYTDQVQQSAHDLFHGRIGLQQVLVASAQAAGKRVPEVIRDDGDIENILHACQWNRNQEIRAEGFSTVSIANVLANVLNKFLLQGYLFVESAWREICGIRPVKDFKPTKSINLFGDFIYQQVGQDGELKHGSLNDQAFANQAQTYGRILVITRTNIINDDLSALTTVPMAMGRGSALKLNDVFWTLFLNPGYDNGGSTNFFAATHTITNETGNSNLSSGVGSALASAGLTAAVLLFDRQVDPKGYPLGIDAEILLYPPELDTTVVELMNAQFLVYGGGSASKQPNSNIWKGRFKPVKSRYMSNSAYTGYSLTAWYLLANPNVLPVIECAFLNGQETPTVQTAQAEFQTLGIGIRGFFDFGVAMQNFRGGVKSAGA